MDENNKPVINLEATAANIKEFRLRKGYSVRDLQKIFGFSSVEAIYGWEKGKYLPSIDNLIILASICILTRDLKNLKLFCRIIRSLRI